MKNEPDKKPSESTSDSENDHNAPEHPATPVERGGGRQQIEPVTSSADSADRLWSNEPGSIEKLPIEVREKVRKVARKCRALKNSDKLKPSTLADYRKKFDRLTSAMGDPGLRPDVEAWTMNLAPYVNASRSFRAYRAAFKFGLIEKIRAGLEGLDRIYESQGSALEWLSQAAHLNSLHKIFKHVDSSTRDSAFWAPVLGKARHGKQVKKDLKVLSEECPQWAEIMVSAMATTRYADAAFVSSLTGARPEELVSGVEVVPHDGDHFAVIITGAKVNEVSGQAWRRLILPNGLLPPAWSTRLISEQRFDISIQSKSAYSESMSRVSRRVLHKLPVVTPYTFRHAFADRLRDHGKPPEEIAGAMGHSVAETQALYGGRAGGGKKRKPNGNVPLQVITARPVRPLDRSGLYFLIGSDPRKGSGSKLKP